MKRTLREQVIEKDGCPLHYWISDDGLGPWLLFLHGAGLDHSTFYHQIEEIPSSFRLVLPDLRGHGLSRPMGKDYSIKLVLDDILAILKHAGCQQATTIGLSMGGNIAQELVYYHPDKVESLMFIGSTCNTLRRSFWEKALAGLTSLLTSFYPWPLLVKQNAWVGCLKLEEKELLKKTFTKMIKEEFLRVLAATANCLRWEPDYRIMHKFLLIYGSHDYTLNLKRASQRWARRDPDCQLREIPAARHCAHLDNPEIVNKYLIDFLYTVYRHNS